MSEIQLEYRSGIKFLTKEGNGPKVIHQRMIIVYGNEAPSLFQNLPPINELKTAVDAYFAERCKDFFLEGMRQLEKRCIKYISLKGSYVENIFFYNFESISHFVIILSAKMSYFCALVLIWTFILQRFLYVQQFYLELK
jgi:hypothetical protein